jgi:hypothetical protein
MTPIDLHYTCATQISKHERRNIQKHWPSKNKEYSWYLKVTVAREAYLELLCISNIY